MLENSLFQELRDMEHGIDSVLRIGMHSWRAQAMLPLILPDFQRKYPKLRLQIFSNVVREMEQMLLRNQLDLFIGHYPAAAPKIRDVFLIDEPIYMVISDNLLKQYFPNIYPRCREDFQHGVNIADFKNVPFILHLESSNMHMAIQKFFAENSIFPQSTLQTNITEMHSAFSAMDYGVSFCPATMLHLIRKNTNLIAQINIFPILNFTQSCRIAIAYLDGTYLPQYASDFIQSAQLAFSSVIKEPLNNKRALNE